MADFATEFITKLNGKLTPEQMKVVLNELEIFSDDYNIEKKCRDVAVPDDLLPACYKVYMVSKKIEGMSPQSLITYKCYLEQFLYAVGKPVEKITANDIAYICTGWLGRTRIIPLTLSASLSIRFLTGVVGNITFRRTHVRKSTPLSTRRSRESHLMASRWKWYGMRALIFEKEQ